MGTENNLMAARTLLQSNNKHYNKVFIHVCLVKYIIKHKYLKSELGSELIDHI